MALNPLYGLMTLAALQQQDDLQEIQGFRVEGLGLRVLGFYGLGFRGTRVEGLGFRV